MMLDLIETAVLAGSVVSLCISLLGICTWGVESRGWQAADPTSLVPSGRRSMRLEFDGTVLAPGSGSYCIAFAAAVRRWALVAQGLGLPASQWPRFRHSLSG